jgi:Lon protease-like protein
MSGAPKVPDLPEAIPIFPLTGALLLPQGVLPLNIFEPRYLNMIEDALGADRMIGMVQPADAGAEGRVESPTVYPVGCAGRITAFRETGDGRYEIVLTGVARFEIAREIEGRRGYRRVVPRWERFLRDLDADSTLGLQRAPLVDALRTLAGRRGLGAEWAPLTELPNRELVNWIAMAVPFHPSEKQALLECADFAERGRLLTTLLEMAAHEGGARGPSRQ